MLGSGTPEQNAEITKIALSDAFVLERVFALGENIVTVRKWKALLLEKANLNTKYAEIVSSLKQEQHQESKLITNLGVNKRFASLCDLSKKRKDPNLKALRSALKKMQNLNSQSKAKLQRALLEFTPQKLAQNEGLDQDRFAEDIQQDPDHPLEITEISASSCSSSSTSESSGSSSSVLEMTFWSYQECTHSLERAEAKPATDKLNDVRSYEFVKLISKGAYGVVWLVKRKLTGDYYAMKITDYAEKVHICLTFRSKKTSTI